MNGIRLSSVERTWCDLAGQIWWLDLVAAGDADGAERLMDRHIRHVRGIWAE